MIQDLIRTLTAQLYPKGRAFKLTTGSVSDKLSKGLSISEAEFFNQSRSLFDSILPDNLNFTIEDAELLEFRYGLISNSLVPLSDRKAAIIRKMNHPGTTPARQGPIYIQYQLQLAGFNVWIHENIPEVSPIQFGAAGLGDTGQLGNAELDEAELGDGTNYISSLIFVESQLGSFQLGQTQLGGFYNNKIANKIIAELDFGFDTGTSYRSSFFIGGEIYGTFADVDQNREAEFRQLVLKLKPTNTIAFIYINYI